MVPFSCMCLYFVGGFSFQVIRALVCTQFVRAGMQETDANKMKFVAYLSVTRYNISIKR
jgi:hypothetical protein